jgi:hypothetical protein
MQLLSVIDTATGVKVAHRAFPAAVQVLVFSAFLLFMALVLAKADTSNASWLPPFDRLPTLAQHALLLLFIGAALALVLWPIIRGIKVLVWGQIWEFDSVRRLVTRNGKAVVSFSEIKSLRIEGDFSGEAPAIATLAIATRAGRMIEIAQGHLHEAQLEGFLDVARRVRARMQIPYEKVGIPADQSGWSYPRWWETNS